MSVKCEVRRAPFGDTLNCKSYAGELGALAGKDMRGLAVVSVFHSKVKHGLRRRGEGTKLYEAAAEAACEHFNAPLASSRTRSNAAERFWRKQHKKGRADCVGDAGGKLRKCLNYVLKCPAPETLAGARLRAR